MVLTQYERYHEKKHHGDPDFPYNTYLCTIPLDFNSVPLHWHDEMEVIAVKKGQGFVSVDLQRYGVQAGDIVVLSPGQLHAIEQNVPHTMEYENILFSLSMLIGDRADICTTHFFAPVQQHTLHLPTMIHPDMPCYTAVYASVSKADALCTMLPRGWQLGIKAALFDLWLALISCATEKPTAHTDKSLDKMKEILAFVGAHAAEKITIERIAAQSGYSASHFMKFFKNVMGISFVDYLNEMRLTTAARMLTASAEPVISIAAACGFENVSYFNRLFKRKYQKTPAAYRGNSVS